jgi:hypothetical protein
MISPGQNGTCNGADQNGTSNGAGATTAGRSRILGPVQDSTVNPDELSELARELAAAFGEKVNLYREHAKLPAEEAVKRAAETSPERIDHILNLPPNEVDWPDLDTLAHEDASLALKRWEQIKEAARTEIRTGYRASRAIEDSGGPWERARFLAVRADLVEDWKPCNAVERQLVDQLAQWQVLLWRWQEAMTTWTNFGAYDLRQAKKGKPHEGTRLTDAEALERATEKVELLNRMYLRTLKALQDQQRPRFPVAAQHAEQMNVGPVQISVGKLNLPFHSREVTP